MKKNFPIGYFVSGIVLGILLTGFRSLPDGFPTTSRPPASLFTATTTTPKITEGGSVSVNTQPAGDTVIVDSVTVPAPGVWVAAREIIDNDLGKVLGAVRIDGPRTHVTIPLLRATEPGRSYAIQLYRNDAGGVFDAAINSAYVDFDTGTRAVAYFTTAD